MRLLQSAQHVRSHWFWRRVAYKNGIIPDEDKPPRSNDEKRKDRQPASNGASSGTGTANGHAGKNGGVQDPTANDHVSRSNAA